MSIEESNGKSRLTKPRLTDMGEGSTPQQRRPGAEQGNQRAAYRASKRANTKPIEDVIADTLSKALGGVSAPAESQAVAKAALELYSDAMRHVGVPSPFVSTFLTRYATNSALAGYFLQRAALAGLDTPNGLALIEASHRCEARSERGMVAAEAAIRAFVGKSKPIDAHGAVVDTFGGSK